MERADWYWDRNLEVCNTQQQLTLSLLPLLRPLMPPAAFVNHLEKPSSFPTPSISEVLPEAVGIKPLNCSTMCWVRWKLASVASQSSTKHVSFGKPLASTYKDL